MHLSRDKSFGQAITEYALPVALIALISIPALIQVSGNLSDFSDATWKTIKGDPSRAAGGSKYDELMSSLMTNQNLGPYQVSYNRDNGMVTFKLPPSMGGGTQTTSVEGSTQLLARMLARMANEYEMPNGKKLPPDLARKLRELSNTASELAAEERRVNDLIDNGQSTPSYWGVIHKYEEFSADYQSLMNAVRAAERGGHPIDEMREVVAGYSGIISVNAYVNFTDKVDKDVYNSGYTKNASQFIVGTTPRRTTGRHGTPVVTDHGAGQIGKAYR